MHRHRLIPTRVYAIFASTSLVLASGFCVAQEDGVPEAALETTTPIRLGETAAEKRIREVLGELTSLDFRDTPLRDVIAFVENQHQVEIELDRLALEDSQYSFDTPVTKELKNVSLRYALGAILDDLNLDFSIDSEVILVTSYETEEPLFWVVYCVRDLLPAPKEGTYFYDELERIIVATVDPSSWEDVGGPAQILGFRNLILIQQTDDAHDEIESLFAVLRSVAETVTEK